MMAARVVWLSDIHLNFVGKAKLAELFQDIQLQDPSAVIISGDIGDAPSVEGYLNMMEASLQIPTYFILGNHDFYHGSLATVRGRVADLASRSRHLVYVTSAGVVPLTENTCLIGHDSWADGRLGDAAASRETLNDYIYIEELAELSRGELFRKLNGLGDESARDLRQKLSSGLASYRHVVVVTHVPPFRETCLHEARISGDEWLPHFSCKAVGDALQEAAGSWPERQVTVLCGHTHCAGEVAVLDNLRVLIAGAEYREPLIQRVFEFD